MTKNNIVEFNADLWNTTTEVVNLSRQGYSPFKSLSTLYRLIHDGKIPVVARGENKKKKYFIQGKDIIAFAESQKITLGKSDEEQM